MNTDLAKRYDNHSVLESHSCALSLELIDKHHIFDHITNLTVEEAKLKLVKMILATDMIFHYELQENMTNILDIIQQKSPDESLADQLTSSPSSTSSSTSLNDQTTTSPIFSSKNSTNIISTSTSTSSSESSSPLTINTSHSITQNLHGTDSVKTISPEPVILRDIFTDLGNESPLNYFINEIYKHKYHNNNINDHRHCHPQQNHKSILVSPSPSHPTSLPSTNTATATAIVATATDSESNDSPSSIDNASSPYSCLNNNKRRKHSGNKKVTIVSPPSLSPPPQEASDKDTSWKNINDDGMILNDEERLILCQILLHGADISNPLRPWPICFEWSKRVCTEFFHQGDMERQHGLQVSPNMDHRRTDQNTVGLQFSDFVVSPYFEIFSALFPKADVLCASLKSNRLQWLRKIEEDQVSSSVSANEKLTSVKSGRKGKTGKIHGGDEDDDEEEEYYGSIPAPFVPNGTNIINPTGRRVSVAAGMAVIPNQLEEKIIGSGKRQRTYLGVRSASYADIIHPSRSMSISLDELEKHRRKSEQPNILRSSLTPI